LNNVAAEFFKVVNNEETEVMGFRGQHQLEVRCVLIPSVIWDVVCPIKEKGIWI
jgi:hypothetical protein